MRFVGGHVSIAGGLHHAIDNTLAIKGNCLQIFAGSPRLWSRHAFPEDEVKLFLNQQQAHHLGPVFIHALYLINLASIKPELLEKSISSLVMDLRNGAQIDSSGVIIHIGSHLGNGFDSVKEQLVTVIREILSETQDCDLILENAAGQNGKIGSLSELSYLLKKVNNPRLKVCLDTAHLFAAGIDLRQEEVVKNLVKDLKDLHLLSKLVCLHLNDSGSDLDSHRDLHADLGKGKIGLEGLKNFVNQPALYHLPLILETPGLNKSGPDAANISIAKTL
jgi:deoxyribonuclease-4